MHMVTRPGSTWPALIFSDSTGAQEDASLCTKNSLPLCKHINFSLERVLLTDLQFDLNVVHGHHFILGEGKKNKNTHSQC